MIPSWSESGGLLYAVGGLPTGLDLVVGWSALDVDDDVQLRAAGSAGDDDALVNRARAGAPIGGAEIVTPAAGRFATTFGQVPVPEGVWILSARSGAGQDSQLTLGVP